MPGKKTDKSNASPPIVLADNNGTVLTDNKSVANLANTFFINVGPMSASINTNNSNYIDNLPAYIANGPPLTEFEPVTKTTTKIN